MVRTLMELRLDGTTSAGQSAGRIDSKLGVHAREDKLGLSVCAWKTLVSIRGRSHTNKPRTGAEHVDEDNHHHTHRNPNRGTNHIVPIPDENCGGTIG